MEKEFLKTRFKRFFRFFLFTFVAMFILRFVYGYIEYSNETVMATSSYRSQNALSINQSQSSDFTLSRKNYATEKVVQTSHTSSVPKYDQKYEKIGSLSSSTKEFEQDEKKARELIKAQKAVIQYEVSSGLEGRRYLNLGIGVNPDKFDEVISEIKKIGKLESVQINKTDKTNEYSDLNAQRISLEKSRNSLLSFKGKGGRIDELINLENKILEIEGSIQKLGVKLGEFDTENEFCTIKFSLQESGRAVKVGWFTPIVKRLKVAFEWTVKFFALTNFLLFFIVLGILVFIIILEKLKIFPDLLKKYLE